MSRINWAAEFQRKAVREGRFPLPARPSRSPQAPKVTPQQATPLCRCRELPCGACGGKGYLRGELNYSPRLYTCPSCEGSGREEYPHQPHTEYPALSGGVRRGVEQLAASENQREFHGIVTRSGTSPSGGDYLTLDTARGMWFNRSRPEYDRTDGAPFPGDGSEVSLTCSPGNNGNRWFVVAIDVISDGRQNGHAQPATPGQTPAPPQAAAPAQTRGISFDDRPIVTRLACLRDAVTLAAANPTLIPATGADQIQDIIRVADDFVRWATTGRVYE